jgi:hypothetical protein
VAAVVAPASAGAASTVGQTFAPTKSVCSGSATFVQETTPAGEYTIPFAGVITSWSYQAGSTPPTQLKLKITRRNFFLNYTIVAESAVQTGLTPNALDTFPTRIPVQAGDRLGLFAAIVADCVNGNPGGNPASGYTAAEHSGDDPVGSTHNYASDSNERLDVSAVLEPDADNDGFGDETQDACPGDAAVQGDCKPPDTTITNAPEDKVKTKKKRAKVTFEFSADEAATFECALDGAAFGPCSSPDTFTVKKGEHSFQVRAVDAAGNVDASPASDSWKVKRKKKK